MNQNYHAYRKRERVPLSSKVACSPLFLLAAAITVVWWDRKCLPLFWLAASIHEGGHLFALRALGGRAEKICFRLTGAEIRYDSSHLSYGQEALLALAGPLANFLAAAILALASGKGAAQTELAVGCHVVLGVFNLLPALPMDGGRILLALLCRRWPMQGERVCRWVGLLIGTAICLFGWGIWKKASNVSLFCAGVIILQRALPFFQRKGDRGKSQKQSFRGK